ncbi:PF08818 domain protein [Leptospira borgpetersenii serovar Pomona str. 200901868]|uniref:PF08818 domain protein n=1 Tax=Leptospira borgpetersenii serovar Pomona str. 200901868 TaxID=1192866 RepID=M6VYK5_LEPBO|nr:PF08818 domain protein [Leptospira borgpetersenii serovar Pomona str. 200901868]
MIRFNLYGYGFKKINFKSVDDYISRFPEDIRKILEELRSVIRKSAPKAEEKISYQIPAFVFHGNLVYFAAYKKHIGFYPTSSGIKAFQNELIGYKTSKGTIQFPIDRPLPLKLIAKIVTYRVKENTKVKNQKL